VSDGVGRAPLNRGEVDRTLARLRDEKERIATSLLELERDPRYRSLAGAPLSGASRRCWEAVQDRLSTLWTLLGAYERVLDDTEQLRARRAKPGQEELAELHRLLNGRSVELDPGDVPPERRSLLGPSSEWLTLDAVVKRMIPLYEEAARTVAAVDAIWSAVLSRLTELENAKRECAAMLDALGLLGPPGAGDPEFDRLRSRLEDIREAARADPLTFTAADHMAPDGRADMTRLDGVADGFHALRTRLAQAVRIRAEHDGRVRGIGETIRQVAAAEAAAREARDLVVAKIAVPVLPDLPGAAGALRERLTAFGLLRDERRWLELAGRAEELEDAAEAALAVASTAVEDISGLLDRRNELRGRLEAYKARAGRLGRAEDAELGRLYRHAHDLLWTAPCDLRRATAALARYQRAIRGAGDG
jgi:hypothetical protein